MFFMLGTDISGMENGSKQQNADEQNLDFGMIDSHEKGII